MGALLLLQSVAPTLVAVSDTASLTLSTDSGSVSVGSPPPSVTGLFLLFQSATTGTTNLSVSDTANLTATEGDVGSFEIVTTDAFDAQLVESVLAAISVDRGDTASIAANEASSVNSSGNTAVAVSDIASLTATDASSLFESLPVTDTASLTLTDSGAVSVAALQINGADTASLSLTEFAAKDVSNTLLVIPVTDTASLSADDVSSLLDVIGQVIAVSDSATLVLVDSGVRTLVAKPVRRVRVDTRIPKVTIH